MSQCQKAEKMSAPFFFFFSGIGFLLFTKFILMAFDTSLYLPLLPSFTLTFVLSLFFGIAFSGWLKAPRSVVSLLIGGLLMALFTILIISLLVFLKAFKTETTFLHRLNFQDLLMIYGLISLSILLSLGVWLIVWLEATVYLFNRHFFPKFLKKCGSAETLHT